MTTKQGKMKKKKTMFEKERHIVAIIKAKANRERVDLCVRSSRDGHASQSTSTVTFWMQTPAPPPSTSSLLTPSPSIHTESESINYEYGPSSILSGSFVQIELRLDVITIIWPVLLLLQTRSNSVKFISIWLNARCWPRALSPPWSPKRIPQESHMGFTIQWLRHSSH